MRVLPDTPIWSAALRRADGVASAYRTEMARLVRQGVVEIIGPIRQELLSGIRESTQFEVVRDHLQRFVDLPIATGDYEEAASYYNRCRAKGIQGSSTDYLICALAVRYDIAIFTDDKDFMNYQKVLPIQLYPFGKKG
ncbi:MAG: PIN domain-containing protein [Verrucomicrobia bacterium]|nr:PIN domain-containing protein [Verrucomicrobiota bacterium]